MKNHPQRPHPGLCWNALGRSGGLRPGQLHCPTGNLRPKALGPSQNGLILLGVMVTIYFNIFQYEAGPKHIGHRSGSIPILPCCLWLKITGTKLDPESRTHQIFPPYWGCRLGEAIGSPMFLGPYLGPYDFLGPRLSASEASARQLAPCFSPSSC